MYLYLDIEVYRILALLCCRYTVFMLIQIAKCCETNIRILLSTQQIKSGIRLKNEYKKPFTRAG
jgi:hypothetical protein